MRKKVYFSEIVFTDKYFINGIDILNEENLVFVKYIDISLDISVSFSKIDNAKLYEIKKSKERIAIAKVRDFNIICYLTFRSMRNICNHSNHKEDCLLNNELLEKLAISSICKEINEDIVYSKDYRSRAVIRENDGIISLSYQLLNVEDEEFFYFNEDISSTNFWQWENIGGISYFASKEDAKKEANLFFENFSTTNLEESMYQEEKELWYHSQTKFESWLYQMKFVGSSTIIFHGLFTILPILGLSSWKIMYILGGCGLLSLLIAGLASWYAGNIILYRITEKGIYAFKGTMAFSTFDNIISIKKNRNLFNKSKGTLKFKLKKGLSINYNFSNISDYETAYDLIKSQLNMQ